MRTYTAHKLSEHMLKRLAQLSSPSGKHEHGTPMGALKYRGLVDDGPERVVPYGDYVFSRKIHDPCCVLNDAGREALSQARALGW